MKKSKPVIAVDFDGVICDQNKPIPGAAEGLQALVDAGFRIVVHTERAKRPHGAVDVYDWLNKYDLPYHEITSTKPSAVLFVDDKALRFIAWPQVIEEAKSYAISQE